MAKRSKPVAVQPADTVPAVASTDEQPGRAISVVRLQALPEESSARTVARHALAPHLRAARTAASVAKEDGLEIQAVMEELAAQGARVAAGDLTRAEEMLSTHAHTLDVLFNRLVLVAHRNTQSLPVFESCLRLAFRAQAQCRATIETLALVKNPPTGAVFAKQANIAHGPQQVNNGVPSARTPEPVSAQNELLERMNGERMDTGAARATGDADSKLAAVDALDGTKNVRGERKIVT